MAHTQRELGERRLVLGTDLLARAAGDFGIAPQRFAGMRHQCAHHLAFEFDHLEQEDHTEQRAQPVPECLGGRLEGRFEGQIGRQHYPEPDQQRCRA